MKVLLVLNLLFAIPGLTLLFVAYTERQPGHKFLMFCNPFNISKYNKQFTEKGVKLYWLAISLITIGATCGSIYWISV